MKQLHMCCMVDLPEDLFSAADTTSKVKPAWEALLRALKESGLVHDAKITVEETRGPVRKKAVFTGTNKKIVDLSEAVQRVE